MKYLIVAFFCLLSVLPCEGRTITVDITGAAEFRSIRAAISDSNDGDVIIVAPGRYYEKISFAGKNIVVRSTDPEDPAIVAGTVIDANSLGPVVKFAGTEVAECVLSGFTITGGNAARGGGIYGGEPSQPGKIGTRATIEHNVVPLNSSTGSGGGLANCDGLIQHNIVTQNTAANAGGGLWHCDGLIRGNTVSYNWSGHQGGGLCGCFGTIRNNVIFFNSTVDWGGGINKSLEPNGVIENNTIYGNSARFGGGLCDCGPSTISNCIVVGNSASVAGNQFYDFSDPHASPSYSCIEGGTQGTGNIDADPCFADAGTGDYHLQSRAGRWDGGGKSWACDGNTSICIDTGNPGSSVGDEPNDGNNVRINIGAYGGSAEASMTPVNQALLADLTNDGIVDGRDFALQAKDWLISGSNKFGDLNRNSIVDMADLTLLLDDWLRTTSRYAGL